MLPRHAEALNQLDAETRLRRSLGRRLESASETLAGLRRLLESTSLEGAWKRGFAVVYGPDGVVTRAAAVSAGTELRLRFADGNVDAVAAGAVGKPPSKRKSRPRGEADDDQGSLL